MRHEAAINKGPPPPPLSASAFVRQQTEPDSRSHSEDEQDNEGTTFSGKRKRPTSVSCELCKQRKVRCDREQPSCGWCARNGAVCEYKERRRPGLRAGFGKELQERMDRLEATLQCHAEMIQTALAATPRPNALEGIRNSNSKANLPSHHQETLGEASTHSYCRSQSQSQADSGIFMTKPSSFTPTPPSIELIAPQHTSSVGSMAPTCRLQSLQPTDAGTQNYYSHSQTALQSPIVSAPPDQDLPPYDLLYALVDLYFKHINTWCPILHRKTTLDSLFGPSTLQETDRILLHAIVATTMRYSSDARLTEDRRQHYHQACKARVLLYGMENTSVKSLQALVILALDVVGSSNGPPGWNILALITRSVVQLGLAVETNSFSVCPSYTSIYTLRAVILPEPKDFIEEESRRRLFWMTYILDRYATIATAFEFALADKEIDRTLPCRDDLWMQNQRVDTKWFKARVHHGVLPVPEICQPVNLGPLAYYIEILGILSKIHTFLKQPVDISAPDDVEQWQRHYKELDDQLTTWRYGLPVELGDMAKLFQHGTSSNNNNTSNSNTSSSNTTSTSSSSNNNTTTTTITTTTNRNPNCILIMLHATFHTAVIRLHSSAAYPTTRSPIFTPSYSASQRCNSAVQKIITLSEFVLQNKLLTKLGPPFAWTIWVSARLLLVHSSTVQHLHKLPPQINFFVDTLREMGHYWPVATRYSGVLQRVLDEHRDSVQKGDGVTPSSVRILADMRRTAFDLDVLISRQPPRNSGAAAAAAGVSSSSSASASSSQLCRTRTPALNELEYLDVFDFFNVPRLPSGPGGENPGAGAGSGAGGGGLAQTVVQEAPDGNGHANEFNITNFLMDANSDWLFKQEGGKFMTTV
ncbi:hypothetical protein E4U56_007436 [Claviceps arundinis]|uniref:Zn(2)-C6 fungal-type domain-containing protein n=1 Tax=Claviceps arundinis TaxID=1623583 RepID=A0A9P7MUM6_9HYPO|nr:hypothetical protein E4U56_007436 [Claviceps arundinis]